MGSDEYIASGLLELYVAGALTDHENIHIAQALEKYPELVEEVLKIEAVFIEIASRLAPPPLGTFEAILRQIRP